MTNSKGYILPLKIELDHSNNHAALALQPYAHFPITVRMSTTFDSHMMGFAYDGHALIVKFALYLNWARSKMF